MEPREGVLESAVDCQIMIAAMKFVLLTTVVTGKDNTKWSKVKSSTHIRCRWQNILTKLPGDIGQVRKATIPLQMWNCPLEMKFEMTFFSMQISILLSNLNSQIKLIEASIGFCA